MNIVEGIATVADVDDFVGDLTAIGEEYGCAVQAFDARAVAGRTHLETAVERANRSTARGENVADDRAVEILLWAAGRRQIDQALALGVTPGECPVAVVIDGSDAADEDRAADAVRDRLAPAETLGVRRDADRIREYFSITAAEEAATTASLEALVIERVSLLAVER